MRFFLVLLAIAPLNAQLLIDTYAGGVIPTGVPAQNVSLGQINGITWDPSGNVVFCDSAYNVIRRVRADGILETIAGSAVTGFGGDGGPATSALIYGPSNPQYDGAGNLYFFDARNLRIRRIDTNGIITTVAGDGQDYIGGLDIEGPATSRAIAPLFTLGITFTVDAPGNIYIAEAGLILRVTLDGIMSMFAQVNSSGGLVVDGSGNVYVAGYGLGDILRITPNGTVSTFVPSSAGFPSFTLISTDAAGNVYASMGGQLLRYAPDGTSTILPAPVGFGGGAMDALGNLAFASTVTPDAYVAIPVIRTFTAGAVLTTIAGGNPQPAPDGTPLRNAWFLGPLSIAFGHTGELYIGEFGACLIRKISAAGVLSTFAGTGKCGYPAPTGTAATASLVYPNSIAINSKDNVWVADEFLNLYSISQQGVLSAMIQTPVSGGKGQLAIDAKDRVYVLGLGTLYRVLPGGSYQNIPAPYSDFAGIGADSADNVYFGIPTLGVYVVNDDASVTLKYPNFNANSLAFDPSGNIWGGAGFLETLNSSGLASIGLDGGFSGDGGPAQSAGMSANASMAFGPDGNLYFVDDVLSALVIVPLAQAAPGISQSILNQDGTLNSTLNPAPRGTIVSFYGTGLGEMNPQLIGGYVAISTPYSTPLNPYSMTIGGQPATIPYAGDAPTLPTGVFQINATIPSNISPGATPVSLNVAGASAHVTLAVK